MIIMRIVRKASVIQYTSTDDVALYVKNSTVNPIL